LKDLETDLESANNELGTIAKRLHYLDDLDAKYQEALAEIERLKN
jgi:hypothetical protein